MSAAVRTEMPPPAHPAVHDREFFRMSVERYEELGAEGILTPNDRVELIEGNLVTKPMQNTPHSSTLHRLDGDLKKAVPDEWQVRIQLPIRILESMPEPDIVIARGDRRSFDRRHPTADEIGLIVEVSDTTLRYDRIIKIPLYARAGITEYWIVNLIDSIVEVYTEPTFDNGYANRRDYTSSESVPFALDGVTIPSLNVGDLLP